MDFFECSRLQSNRINLILMSMKIVQSSQTFVWKILEISTAFQSCDKNGSTPRKQRKQFYIIYSADLVSLKIPPHVQVYEEKKRFLLQSSSYIFHSDFMCLNKLKVKERKVEANKERGGETFLSLNHRLFMSSHFTKLIFERRTSSNKCKVFNIMTSCSTS